MQVWTGIKSRTHASRQCVHLIRTAAPLDFTSIAVHAHLLARQIQRKRLNDTGRLGRKSVAPLSDKENFSVNREEYKSLIWLLLAELGSCLYSDRIERSGSAFLSLLCAREAWLSVKPRPSHAEQRTALVFTECSCERRECHRNLVVTECTQLLCLCYFLFFYVKA